MPSRSATAVSLALVAFLGTALAAVPGGTWARLSDHDSVRVHAGAGTWASDVPAGCGPLDQYAGVKWGTMADDRLQGDDRPRVYMALGGDDTLVGGTGADCLVGGIGDDRLVVDDGDIVVGESEGDLVEQAGLQPSDLPVTAAPVGEPEPQEPEPQEAQPHSDGLPSAPSEPTPSEPPAPEETGSVPE